MQDCRVVTLALPIQKKWRRRDDTLAVILSLVATSWRLDGKQITDSAEVDTLP
jgi:hypothetical protein